MIKGWDLLKKAFTDMQEHGGVEYAGYLAFLFLLSFFPFVFFLITTTRFIGELDISVRLVEGFLDAVPEHVANELSNVAKGIFAVKPPRNVLLLSILGAAWTSSSLIGGISTILSRAYRTENGHPYLLQRLWYILQFLVLIIVLIVAMVSLIVIPAVWNQTNELLLEFTGYSLPANWLVLNYISIPFILFLVVILLHSTLLGSRQKLKPIILSSLITVIGWIAVGRLFSLYLKMSLTNVNLIYGSLGGIIVTLIFFYAISLVLIFSAELSYNLTENKIRKN